MITDDKEIFFTLKFYRGQKGTYQNDGYAFKTELDFNYPFNLIDNRFQSGNSAMKRGELSKSMKVAFDKLEYLFNFIDNLDPKVFEGESDTRGETVQNMIDMLKKADTISRIKFSQFNPRELYIESGISLRGNGDPKPPKL